MLYSKMQNSKYLNKSSVYNVGIYTEHKKEHTVSTILLVEFYNKYVPITSCFHLDSMRLKRQITSNGIRCNTLNIQKYKI